MTTIRGRLVYSPLLPAGNRGVAGAEVELWDADLGPSGDDLIARTLTDEDGAFRFDFDFDRAHGNDPPRVRVGPANLGPIDALRPYIKVRLDGVDEGHDHPVAITPANLPAPRIPVSWTAPRVCLPQDLAPLDRATRAARQALDALPYQWLRLDRVDGAPDVTFDPPIWMLSPAADGLGLIDDIALPPLELPGLVNPAPGSGAIYLQERRAEGARIDHARDDAADLDYADAATFRAMFGTLGLPASVARVEPDGRIPDAWFAEQRLVGLNPMKICRLGSKQAGAAPPDFAPAADRVRRLTGSTWQQLVDEGRLYVCDYTWMRDVAEKHRAPGRFLPAPYAVFYRTRPAPRAASSGRSLPANIDRARDDLHRAPRRDLTLRELPELLPLGILTTAGGPIHMPGDGAAWEFAKLLVQVADVNEHELCFHLWGCHISMEPFAMAAARALALTHPLRELLRRHFFGLLWINQYGLRHLVNVSGDPRRPVKDFLAATFSGSMELMHRGRATWSIAQRALPRDLIDRGLDDPERSLRHYPYRDDGRLLWRAIAGFVDEYVDLYYDAPHDVRDDDELTAFYRELADHHVPDVGRPDHPDVAGNLVALKEHLTQILWVSTALHNLLNAPQYPMAGYAGNHPTASNLDPAGPAPADVTAVYTQGASADDSSRTRALGMMGLTAELSLYNPDGPAGGLGHYRFWGRWKDPRVEPVVARFQERLREVDQAIVRANGERPLRWDWLRPKLMANSTST